MQQQQYNFKSNNGSGSGSSSNLGYGSSTNRENLKNLMKKQQLNINFIDNQFTQESMNRTQGLGNSNSPISGNFQNNNRAQNPAYQKIQGNNNTSQQSMVDKMIEEYQKNRPVNQQQYQQYQPQQLNNSLSNNYGQSPLRNNYNNINSNYNANSSPSRAITAQDSRRESNYNNYINEQQLERKSSLGRNKLESSDPVSLSSGKFIQSSNNNQTKSSTNKVQQMLKDLMGNNQIQEKPSYSQYQTSNNYSKSNLNRTENVGNQENSNYFQNYQNRNEVSSLRSRENSNERFKTSANNTTTNISAQNHLYSSPSNQLNTNNGILGRKNSGSTQQNTQNNNNISMNSGINYKSSATIEISNSNNQYNEQYTSKLLKASNSSKNLQPNYNDLEIKKQTKTVANNNATVKAKTPSVYQQSSNQGGLSSTLNRNNSNSKLRLQDDIIEQVYKNNRSVTPKYGAQQQINNGNKFQNSANNVSVTQASKSKQINNMLNQQQSNQKLSNEAYYQQIIGNSGQKSPSNNNGSFTNGNNTSFNSVSNLKGNQQNTIDLQNRRMTPTLINQNIEMLERHQSLQNITQMPDQQLGQTSYQQQQQQNKSPLRANNYMQQQYVSSSKENVSQNSNNSHRGPSHSTNNVVQNNIQQRETSKSPSNTTRNNTTPQIQQNQGYEQIHSQQILSSKQPQQQIYAQAQMMKGSSQEAKNNYQQVIQQKQQQQHSQQKPLLSKSKQLNSQNQGQLSGGISQQSSSSSSSNQKSVEMNQQSNTTASQSKTSMNQQNQIQKLLQTQQQFLKEQQNQNQSGQASPCFGNSNQNNFNEYSNNLKKINPSNQNDLLKTIQEQIKTKNDRRQDSINQPKKQKNKISQDFLDSTYFQFNAQLIEQIQQEQLEDQQHPKQNTKDSSSQLKDSIYLTSLKQEPIQQYGINTPTITQIQSQSQSQTQILSPQQQNQKQAQQQQKSKLNQAQPQQQIQIQINNTLITNSPSNQQNKQLVKDTLQTNKDVQQSSNISIQQYLQKQNINSNLHGLEDEEEVKSNNVKQTQKKNQTSNLKEKNQLALNNDLESIDSTNTTACFSEELSKSTLAKINLLELLQIEQNLFDLQKHGFKNKKHTTKFCKNYLNSIAEQNVDNLERICSDSRQSNILTRMFILERICVILSLHQSLNGSIDSDQQSNDEEDDDYDCTDHIKNSLQYVHLNFFLFLDTVINKYNFNESTKSVEQQVKKIFETRTKTKRFASCLSKQDKFQVISNYCDIIVPYLKNFVHNQDKQPFLAIAKILNSISSQSVSGTMAILMDCFSKIILDLEERAIKDSKSLIEESFSDNPVKQENSTEKSKSTSISSTSEKQKKSDEQTQKQSSQNEQKQKSQQENSIQPSQNKQENLQKQPEKGQSAQIEDQEDEDDDDDDMDIYKQIGTIPAPYLPDLEHSNKHTLVLDLDETLVHYQEIPDEGGQFLIRPNAEEFLVKMAQYYEIVIFTAAVQDYADFILNVIDSQNSISHRLYRQHTDIEGRSFVKDISKLGRDLSKTLIIDNLPENFARQPKNGVLIQSWYGEPDDRALFDLVPLLTDITKSKKFKDVREALQKLREQTMKNLMNGVHDPHINIVLDEID